MAAQQITSRFAIFNGWNFNNVQGLTIYSILLPGNAQRNINIFNLARRNGRKVTSAYYQVKTVTLGVYIVASQSSTTSGRDALDLAVDQLLANIQGVEGQLVVPRSGGVRLYNCTYAGYTVNDQKGAYADLTLTFECSDASGYDTTYTTIFPQGNVTASPFTFGFTQGGSFDTQSPIIQAKLTAFTGTNPSTVIIGNSNTGASVSITRTWSLNDLILVDCQNKKVTVNGVEVSPNGGFPDVGLGVQSLYIQDGFTTRTWSLFAYVYNRYI